MDSTPPPNSEPATPLPVEDAATLRQQVQTLLNEAWAVMRADPTSACEQMEHAFALAAPVLDDELRLQECAWQAELHYKRGELPACLAAAGEARRFEHLPTWSKYSKIILSNSGRAQALMGRYSEALGCFQQLYQICLQEGNRPGEASNLNNMALICCSTGDLATAHRLFQQALAMHRELGDLQGECFIYNNLAMFPREGEEEEALNWARHALEIARGLGRPGMELMVLDTLGGLLLRCGQLEEARPLLVDAIRKARENHDLRNLAPAQLNLARLLLAAGEPEAALAQLDDVQPMLDRQNMDPERVTCHELRAEALERQGRIPEALAELRRHLELKNQVLSAAEQERVKNLQILHETEVQRREAEGQRRKALEMEGLAAMGREITASLDLQTVLERINERSRELMRAGDSVIYLLQPDGVSLRAIAVSGRHVQELSGLVVPLEGSLAGAVCRDGRAEVVNHPGEDARILVLADTNEHEGERPADYAMAAAALGLGDESLGTLLVWRERRGSGEFDPQDLGVLVALAQQAAIAIHNARLFEELHEAKQAAEAALAQVKTLKGLVPICASCKNIRDDAGFWHNVADYIKDHTEAEFSHGLCPGCMRKLYPELAPDEEDEAR
ncbi:MAG: tetratricopeptide repeat protein [Candidatus Delongbacteria bacterium]